MKHTYLVLVVLLASASALHAEDKIDLYSGGLFKFSFRQFPFGPLSGGFHAEGNILDPSEFPPDEDGASTGFVSEIDGESRLGVFGGYLNVDDSADLAFLTLRSDVSLAPGVYRIDPQSGDVAMGFIDNGRGIVLPDKFEELATFGWRDWFERVDADHKFTSIYGFITLTVVETDQIRGTFEGLMVEREDGTVIAVSDAEFALTPRVLAVDEISWGMVKSLYRD